MTHGSHLVHEQSQSDLHQCWQWDIGSIGGRALVAGGVALVQHRERGGIVSRGGSGAVALMGAVQQQTGQPSTTVPYSHVVPWKN